MSYSIIIASPAKDELEESYNWYEMQKSGLGERFIGIIERSISLISNHPEFIQSKLVFIDNMLCLNFPMLLSMSYCQLKI